MGHDDRHAIRADVLTGRSKPPASVGQQLALPILFHRGHRRRGTPILDQGRRQRPLWHSDVLRCSPVVQHDKAVLTYIPGLVDRESIQFPRQRRKDIPAIFSAGRFLHNPTALCQICCWTSFDDLARLPQDRIRTFRVIGTGAFLPPEGLSRWKESALLVCRRDPVDPVHPVPTDNGMEQLFPGFQASDSVTLPDPRVRRGGCQTRKGFWTRTPS